MGERTHYEVLGVASDASAEAIRSAYRRMAKVAHPDTGGSSALMSLLTDAYNVLSHAPLRREYDDTLAAPSRPVANHPARPSKQAGPTWDVYTESDRPETVVWLRALAAVTASVLLAAALRLSGAAAAAFGVADGTSFVLGTYQVVPKILEGSWTAVVLPVIGVGLLLTASRAWQRRISLGHVHQAELWAVAAWTGAVAGSGELLLARPVFGGVAVALAAGYCLFVWARTRPEIPGWTTRQAASSRLRRLWWRGPWRQTWNRLRR